MVKWWSSVPRQRVQGLVKRRSSPSRALSFIQFNFFSRDQLHRLCILVSASPTVAHQGRRPSFNSHHLIPADVGEQWEKQPSHADALTSQDQARLNGFWIEGRHHPVCSGAACWETWGDFHTREPTWLDSLELPIKRRWLIFFVLYCCVMMKRPCVSIVQCELYQVSGIVGRYS